MTSDLALAKDIETRFCSRCACENDDASVWCPVRSYELLGQNTGAWIVDGGGAPTCRLFQEWTASWRRPRHPTDPYAGQLQSHRYKLLPRDPSTGRPVIR